MSVKAARWKSKTSGALDQYMHEISNFPLIDRSEEARLARGAREGDSDALNTLVRSNLRFVVSVAKRYQNLGVPLADLINEGNVGLIHAAGRFDETKEIKFISYAVWWIRQAILQALAEQGRIVRIPMNRTGEVSRMTRARAKLRQELGRDPSVKELATARGISQEEVELTLLLTQSYVSLDAPTSTTDDGRLMDYLPSNDIGADRRVFDQALDATINEALSSLKTREAKVLRLYYGLDDQNPMTLQQIGAQLGVTRERVRQIKEKALVRLRHASRRRPLEPFVH
jgi:RNA polymerase primary sigma factor